jgi:hypothetical protein
MTGAAVTIDTIRAKRRLWQNATGGGYPLAQILNNLQKRRGRSQR